MSISFQCFYCRCCKVFEKHPHLDSLNYRSVESLLSAQQISFHFYERAPCLMCNDHKDPCEPRKRRSYFLQTYTVDTQSTSLWIENSSDEEEEEEEEEDDDDDDDDEEEEEPEGPEESGNNDDAEDDAEDVIKTEVN